MVEGCLLMGMGIVKMKGGCWSSIRMGRYGIEGYLVRNEMSRSYGWKSRRYILNPMYAKSPV